MALITVNMFSDVLNRSVMVNVIYPSDAHFIAGKPVPLCKKPLKTLYLLHGILNNHNDWVIRTRIQEIAYAHNLCVVMPSGENKFYSNSDISGDRFGDYISKELVEFIQRTFHVSKAREDTFIGGLSMGGFGAITNGLRNPDTFSRIVAFSSYLLKPVVLSIGDEPDVCRHNQRHYLTMFGIEKPEDFIGSENDFEFLADQLASSGKDLPKIYMSAGTEDPYFWMSEQFQERLVKNGYDVTWVPQPGGHNYGFWDMAIEQVMDWLPLADCVPWE